MVSYSFHGNANLNLGFASIVSLNGVDDNDLLLRIADNVNITIDVNNAGIISKGIVEIIDNAVLTLDNTNFFIGSNGRLEAKNGGTLELSSGTNLTISGNGIAGPKTGGTLIYNNGTSVVLTDDNSVLEIDGVLNIDNNTDFDFTGNGFFRFGNATIQPGTNSKIIMEGSGTTDKVLEVVGATYFPPSLTQFRLLTGTALFTGGSLAVESAMFVADADLTGNGDFVVYGQIGTIIDDCTFDGVSITGWIISVTHLNEGLYLLEVFDAVLKTKRVINLVKIA